MNKALSIQRSKITSCYGGVGTNIDTIDNLSLLIRPFDEWNIHEMLQKVSYHKEVKRLLFKEERLCARLKSIGFKKLDYFFLLEDYANEVPVKPWMPQKNEKERMVTSLYFPRWFYCPKCNRFKPIEGWGKAWTHDKKWGDNVPACFNCSRKSSRGYYRSPLQQIRFVMASMESGEITDIPWNKIFSKKGKSDETAASVWYIDDSTPESKDVRFVVSRGSSDLYGLSVTNEHGVKITLAEIMSRYIVMPNSEGREIVYHPVVRNANNVYFGYNVSSVFIPRKNFPLATINQIKGLYDNGITDSALIKKLGRIDLSETDIKTIIDSDFTSQKPLVYTNEDDFRTDEFDFLTDSNNYSNNGIYTHEEGRLISEIYDWNNKPDFISKVFFQRRINVTTVQVAYSRIDKISISSLPYWKGRSDMPKQWYNPLSKTLDKSIDVKLHPTCKKDIARIDMMPAVSCFGEGFFVELNLTSIPKEDRFVFLHTLCHLIMKELEFSCGYPLASLSERLYYLPKRENDTSTTARNRFGFLIYSASGESGSYGGITSLFYSGKFNKIIEQAILLAQDCPNDPICEDDKGHCFACVDLPETSCEEFNKNLNRIVVKRNTVSTGQVQTEKQQNGATSQGPTILEIMENDDFSDDEVLD